MSQYVLLKKEPKALLYQEIAPNAFLEQGLTAIGKSVDSHDTTFNQTILFAPREKSAPSCIACEKPCPARKFLTEGGGENPRNRVLEANLRLFMGGV